MYSIRIHWNACLSLGYTADMYEREALFCTGTVNQPSDTKYDDDVAESLDR